MNVRPSVLIVDRSEETREVLQTVLERHGVRTMSAGRTAAGLELARRHHPDLIVLDLEMDDASYDAGETPGFFGDCPDFCGHRGEAVVDENGTVPFGSEQYQPRLVLLGNLRGWRDRLPDGEFVRKPYHYGLLIRKIEELLATETQAGNLARADVVRDSRSRPGLPLRADRADRSPRA